MKTIGASAVPCASILRAAENEERRAERVEVALDLGARLNRERGAVRDVNEALQRVDRVGVERAVRRDVRRDVGVGVAERQRGDRGFARRGGCRAADDGDHVITIERVRLEVRVVERHRRPAWPVPDTVPT